MKNLSWIILALVGALTLLGSLASARLAYMGGQEVIGSVEMSDLAKDRPQVAVAIRARRATSAAFAAGYAVLFLSLVFGPYRKGESWSAWALLGGVVVVTGITLGRVPALGTQFGVGTALSLLGLTVLGLGIGWLGSRAGNK